MIQKILTSSSSSLPPPFSFVEAIYGPNITVTLTDPGTFSSTYSPRRIAVETTFTFSEDSNIIGPIEATIPSTAASTKCRFTRFYWNQAGTFLAANVYQITFRNPILTEYGYEQDAFDAMRIIYLTIGASSGAHIIDSAVCVFFEKLSIVEIDNVARTFQAGQARCAGQGGFLVTLLKPTDEAEITSQLQTNGVANFWVGGYAVDNRPADTLYCWRGDPDFEESGCTDGGYYAYFRVTQAGGADINGADTAGVTCIRPSGMSCAGYDMNWDGMAAGDLTWNFRLRWTGGPSWLHWDRPMNFSGAGYELGSICSEIAPYDHTPGDVCHNPTVAVEVRSLTTSKTFSLSISSSLTDIPTGTKTFSRTHSFTKTLSATQSLSKSFSRTTSTSKSLTISKSKTLSKPTASLSRTFGTISLSDTIHRDSATSTFTLSKSIEPTMTETIDATPSESHVATPTATFGTDSATESQISSKSITETPSRNSPSLSKSDSATLSKSLSSSESPTSSKSESLSFSESVSTSETLSMTRELIELLVNISNFTNVIAFNPLDPSIYNPKDVWSRSCSSGWKQEPERVNRQTEKAICRNAGFEAYPVWDGMFFKQQSTVLLTTFDAGKSTNYIDLAGLQCPLGDKTLYFGTNTCGFQKSGENCTLSKNPELSAPWAMYCYSDPADFSFKTELDGTIRVNAGGDDGLDYWGFMCRDRQSSFVNSRVRQSICNILAAPLDGAGWFTGASRFSQSYPRQVTEQKDFVLNNYGCSDFDNAIVLNSGNFTKIIDERRCSYQQNTPHLQSHFCNIDTGLAIDCQTNPLNWNFAVPEIQIDNPTLRAKYPQAVGKFAFVNSTSPRADHFSERHRLLLARPAGQNRLPWGVVCPSPNMDNQTAIFLCRKSYARKTVRAYFSKVNASRYILPFLNQTYNMTVYGQPEWIENFSNSVNFESVKNGALDPSTITSPWIDTASTFPSATGNISSTYLPIAIQNINNCRWYNEDLQADCASDYIISTPWVKRSSPCNPDGEDATDETFVTSLVCIQEDETEAFQIKMNLTNGVVLVNHTVDDGETSLTEGWGTFCQSEDPADATTGNRGGTALCTLMRWPGVITTAETDAIVDYQPASSLLVGAEVECKETALLPNPFTQVAQYHEMTLPEYCVYQNETADRERHSDCPRLSVNCHISKTTGWWFTQSPLSGTVLLRPRFYGTTDVRENPWGSMMLNFSLSEEEARWTTLGVCKSLGWRGVWTPTKTRKSTNSFLRNYSTSSPQTFYEEQRFDPTITSSSLSSSTGTTSSIRLDNSTIFWADLFATEYYPSLSLANVYDWSDFFWTEGANGADYQRNSRSLHPFDLAVDCYRDPATWKFKIAPLTGLLLVSSQSSYWQEAGDGVMCQSPDLVNDTISDSSLTTKTFTPTALAMCKLVGYENPTEAVMKRRNNYPTWPSVLTDASPRSSVTGSGHILISNLTSCDPTLPTSSNFGDVCEYWLESLPSQGISRNLCTHDEDVVVDYCHHDRTSWEAKQERGSSLLQLRPSSSTLFGTVCNGSLPVLQAEILQGVYPDLNEAVYKHTFEMQQQSQGVKTSMCKLLGWQGKISSRTSINFTSMNGRFVSEIDVAVKNPNYLSNLNCSSSSSDSSSGSLFDCNYTESPPGYDITGCAIGSIFSSSSSPASPPSSPGGPSPVSSPVNDSHRTRTFSHSITEGTETASHSLSNTDLASELDGAYRMFIDCRTAEEDFEFRINTDRGGRVETRPNSTAPWGTICNRGSFDDEYFNQPNPTYVMSQETAVALCRMSGMPQTSWAKIINPSNFTQNDPEHYNTPIYLQNLNCSSEAGKGYGNYSLLDCEPTYIQSDAGTLNRTTCSHDDDVAILCFSSNETETQEYFDQSSSSSSSSSYWQFNVQTVANDGDLRLVYTRPNDTDSSPYAAPDGVICSNPDTSYRTMNEETLCHFLNFPGVLTEAKFFHDGISVIAGKQQIYLSDLQCELNQSTIARPSLQNCTSYVQSDTHVSSYEIGDPSRTCSSRLILFDSCKSDPSSFRFRLIHQGDPLQVTANKDLNSEYGLLSLSSATSQTFENLLSLCYNLGWHHPVSFSGVIDGNYVSVNETNPILMYNLECAFPSTKNTYWYNASVPSSFSSRTLGVFSQTCTYKQFTSRYTPPTSYNADQTVLRNFSCYTDRKEWQVKIDETTNVVYVRPSNSARWGTVCHNEMNIEAAHTLCRMTGVHFIESLSFEQVDLSSTLTFPSTPQYLGGMQCRDNATWNLNESGKPCWYQEASEETLLMPYLGCSHASDTKIFCVPRPSRTPTSSPTKSASASFSESLTPEETQTHELTASPTETSSLSSSSSVSPSTSTSLEPTETKTHEATPSESESLSSSFTQSKSASSSLSESRSISSTETASLIPTPSQTHESTETQSETPSLSESLSKSETISQSHSASPSLTDSHSESRSASKSVSESLSRTSSLSKSESHSTSISKSESISQSLSKSSSLSMSESLSKSAEPTFTKELTESKSISDTSSHTSSLSETTSPSKSSSQSQSETPSTSSSASVSFSSSTSPSQTKSLSFSRSLSTSQSLSSSISDPTETYHHRASFTEHATETKTVSETETYHHRASFTEHATESKSTTLSTSLSESETQSRSGETPSASSTLEPTPSESHVATESKTETLSQTESPSLSASRSLSSTDSQSTSASQSPSASTSESVSQSTSQTSSPSVSESITKSEEPTLTKELTQSKSISETPSESETSSVSSSISASRSASHTETGSTSQTASSSISQSHSLSETQSSSLSRSQSESISQSRSSSESLTPSSSTSLEPTESRTHSETATETVSQSTSRSSSISESQSVSPSLSETYHHRGSITHMATETESHTSSPSSTSSISSSASLSRTSTSSPSASSSMSRSISSSLSLSQSISLSSSVSSSASVSGKSPSHSITHEFTDTYHWKGISFTDHATESRSQLTPTATSSETDTPSFSSTKSQSISVSESQSETESDEPTPSRSVSISETLTSRTPQLTVSKSKATETLSQSLTPTDSTTDTKEETSTRSIEPTSSKTESSTVNSSLTQTVPETHSGEDHTQTLTKTFTKTDSGDARWKQQQEDERRKKMKQQLSAALDAGVTVVIGIGALFVQPVNFVFLGFCATALMASQHDALRRSTLTYYLSPPVEILFGTSIDDATDYRFQFDSPSSTWSYGAAPRRAGAADTTTGTENTDEDVLTAQQAEMKTLQNRFGATVIVMLIVFCLHLIVTLGLFFFYFLMLASTHSKSLSQVLTVLKIACAKARFPAFFLIPFQLGTCALAYQSGVLFSIDSTNSRNRGFGALVFIFAIFILIILNFYFGIWSVETENRFESKKDFEKRKKLEKREQNKKETDENKNKKEDRYKVGGGNQNVFGDGEEMKTKKNLHGNPRSHSFSPNNSNLVLNDSDFMFGLSIRSSNGIGGGESDDENNSNKKKSPKNKNNNNDKLASPPLPPAAVKVPPSAFEDSDFNASDTFADLSPLPRPQQQQSPKQSPPQDDPQRERSPPSPRRKSVSFIDQSQLAAKAAEASKASMPGFDETFGPMAMSTTSMGASNTSATSVYNPLDEKKQRLISLKNTEWIPFFDKWEETVNNYKKIKKNSNNNKKNGNEKSDSSTEENNSADQELKQHKNNAGDFFDMDSGALPSTICANGGGGGGGGLAPPSINEPKQIFTSEQAPRWRKLCVNYLLPFGMYISIKEIDPKIALDKNVEDEAERQALAATFFYRMWWPLFDHFKPNKIAWFGWVHFLLAFLICFVSGFDFKNDETTSVNGAATVIVCIHAALFLYTAAVRPYRRPAAYIAVLLVELLCIPLSLAGMFFPTPELTTITPIEEITAVRQAKFDFSLAFAWLIVIITWLYFFAAMIFWYYENYAQRPVPWYQRFLPESVEEHSQLPGFTLQRRKSYNAFNNDDVFGRNNNQFEGSFSFFGKRPPPPPDDGVPQSMDFVLNSSGHNMHNNNNNNSNSDSKIAFRQTGAFGGSGIFEMANFDAMDSGANESMVNVGSWTTHPKQRETANSEAARKMREQIRIQQEAANALATITLLKNRFDPVKRETQVWDDIELADQMYKELQYVRNQTKDMMSRQMQEMDDEDLMTRLRKLLRKDSKKLKQDDVDEVLAEFKKRLIRIHGDDDVEVNEINNEALAGTSFSDTFASFNNKPTATPAAAAASPRGKRSRSVRFLEDSDSNILGDDSKNSNSNSKASSSPSPTKHQAARRKSSLHLSDQLAESLSKRFEEIFSPKRASKNNKEHSMKAVTQGNTTRFVPDSHHNKQKKSATIVVVKDEEFDDEFFVDEDEFERDFGVAGAVAQMDGNFVPDAKNNNKNDNNNNKPSAAAATSSSTLPREQETRNRRQSGLLSGSFIGEQRPAPVLTVGFGGELRALSSSTNRGSGSMRRLGKDLLDSSSDDDTDTDDSDDDLGLRLPESRPGHSVVIMSETAAKQLQQSIMEKNPASPFMKSFRGNPMLNSSAVIKKDKKPKRENRDFDDFSSASSGSSEEDDDEDEPPAVRFVMPPPSSGQQPAKKSRFDDTFRMSDDDDDNDDDDGKPKGYNPLAENKGETTKKREGKWWENLDNADKWNEWNSI